MSVDLSERQTIWITNVWSQDKVRPFFDPSYVGQMYALHVTVAVPIIVFTTKKNLPNIPDQTEALTVA